MTEPSDWRTETVQEIRGLLRAALPAATEEAKWRKASNPDGVPTWSQDGLICTVETYHDKVKLTFAEGASLDDPHHVFNASLDAGTRRAIDIKQGERVDAAAFKALAKAAARYNMAKKKR